MSWTTSWSEGKILPCGTDYGMSIPPAVLAPASSASRPAITASCGRMKRVHLTHQDLNATNALAIERIQPVKVPTTLENAYQDPVSSSDPIASQLISSHLISSPTRSLETRKSLPPALTRVTRFHCTKARHGQSKRSSSLISVRASLAHKHPKPQYTTRSLRTLLPITRSHALPYVPRPRVSHVCAFGPSVGNMDQTCGGACLALKMESLLEIGAAG